MRWRKLDGDICEIKQRLSRIEGRCEVIHQDRVVVKEPEKATETPLRFALTHWKAISAFLGFVILWARSGAGVSDAQIKSLQSTVAWMAANW